MAEECEVCLSIETIIKSTVDLEDIGEIVGGSCLTIFTTDETVVSAACPTKTYSGVDEALDDFGAIAPTNDAITAAFSQTPRVAQVVVAFYDPADVTTLTEASKCSKCKGFSTPELRDDAAQPAIAAWAEANKCFYFADVCDPLHEAADPSTIGAQITAAGYEYTEIFYHTDCDVQKATAYASWSLGHDYGQAGQDYTQVFGDVVGVPPVNIDTQTLENLTGFSSVTGLDSSAVQHVNVCACVEGCGGATFFWGLTASGDFFDNRHYACSVDERIEAALCNVLTSGVASTASGYVILQDAIKSVLRTDQLNGYIAGGFGNDIGAGYTVSIPSPDQLGQAFRSNRIAGCIDWTAPRNNPVHIACSNGLITQ